MILCYITCSDNEEARNIGEYLVQHKLAACCNVFPITSFYKLKGSLKDDNEIVLIAKTTEDKWEELKKKVISIHSYDTPCILKMDVECNSAYEKWVKEELK